MKSRSNSKREENRAAAASLLAELDEEMLVEVGERSQQKTQTFFQRKESGFANGIRPDVPISKNLSQSEAKVESKLGQSEANHKPKLSHKPESKLSRNSEENPKVEPQLRPKVESILSQSKAKVEPTASLESLIGLQRNALKIIYDSCRSNGNKVSGPIAIQNVALRLETTAAAVRKALQRLEQKRFIIRAKYKDGRGGWTQYGLPDGIYSDLLMDETRAKVEPKLGQSEAKVRTKLEPQLEPSVSSSSRDLLIKEESTTTHAQATISQIDLGLVQSFGITTSVLARCIELYPVLKPEQLEVLVFRFAEFAKDPKNKVQNARGFFISLAEQASKGQVPLDHIETPDDRLMRLFVERQKEAKARQTETERAAQEFECEAWLERLTPEMKLSLIPETAILKTGTAAHSAMLKRHFVENVWPQRRTEILQAEATL